MTRRPRRTPAVAAAWSVGAVALSADTAVLAASAARSHSTAALMATVATAYIATLALAQALAYGCSAAWYAGRSHPRTDRAPRPPSRRPAYTPQALSQIRQDAAAREQRHTDTLTAARHARREAEQPVRDGSTARMPIVVVDAQPWPWSPPVAEPVAAGAHRGRT